MCSSRRARWSPRAHDASWGTRHARSCFAGGKNVALCLITNDAMYKTYRVEVDSDQACSWQ